MAAHESSEDPLLGPMVRAIVEEVDPAQVILFGSRARQEHGAASDVDLLVVEDQAFGPGRSRRAEATRLYRRLAGSKVAKDIVVVSRDEVEKWRGSVNHVIAVALREGRLLYERP
ncbi:MAG: nucleotidyltransferase domain-containing protein [Deferrisomatales bacterium]